MDELKISRQKKKKNLFLIQSKPQNQVHIIIPMDLRIRKLIMTGKEKTFTVTVPSSLVSFFKRYRDMKLIHLKRGLHKNDDKTNYVEK